MKFPALKTRPRSTRTVTDFCGLWHNLEDLALVGNSSSMRWYDERNLSADKAPALSSTRKDAAVEKIDGNTLAHPVVAANTEGDHAVLLDDHGILHCNGHSINTLGPNGLIYLWYIYHDATQAEVVISPRTGSTYDPTDLGGLLQDAPSEYDIELDYSSLANYPGSVNWIHRDDLSTTIFIYTYAQETIGGITYDTWTLTDLGIKIMADNVIDSGWKAHVLTHVKGTYGNETSMVRMGANIIILPEGIMVDAVKLAAGETVELQALNANWKLPAVTAQLTFNPCLMDGTVVTPVKGTTAPGDLTDIWADTTGEKTVMRQWSSAMSSWQAMQQTHVRVDIGDLVSATERVNDELREGDVFQFDCMKYEDLDILDANSQYISGNTVDEMHYILHSAQRIVKRYDEDNDLLNVHTHYIVIEGILDEQVDVLAVSDESLALTRKAPTMDFVVECGNRLWGCFYGVNDAGEHLNEIYCSKLGDPTNWQSYQGLSTDSWAASRGTSAPFTGAAVLDGSPLFFREEYLEKVYPSATGAHQIQTYSVDGVEAGSHRSLVVIDDKLYYKSRRGIMVYEGTLPRSISAAFGEMTFSEGTAARYKKRYAISMRKTANERIAGVYDISSGDWHLETSGWTGCAFTWNDELYYGDTVPGFDTENHKRYGGAPADWWAETGLISYELPEHKFVSCIRIRISTEYTSTFKAYIMYDGSGTWLEKASFMESGPGGLRGTKEINIYPLRCDHFRLKLAGTKGTGVVSLSYRLERSEGGH